MKKLYLFFVLLLSINTFAQPIITMIADGDESGGTPAVLEIYAKGTVDFTQYSLQNQTNASTTWGNNFDLSSLGTVTDDFVYVYSNKNSSTDAFAVNFPSVTTNKLDATSAAVLNINGDDRIRIIETSTGTVVDVYGQDGVDGSGKPWEYTDGYAKRLDGTGPDPVFVEANWEFHKGALNGHGAIQDGTTYESIIGIGTYQPAAVSTPSLAITAPTPNQVFAPNVTDVQVEFVVQNFTVAQAGGDGYIVYTFDNDPPVNKYDTNPIVLSNLTPGTSHQVSLKLVDNSGNDLNPPVTASVTFSIAAYTQVATIADLRAGTVGDYYHYTGEAFAIGGITYQSGNFKGFAQDATGGIMAFVPSSVMATAPVLNLYDGVTDVKGQLKDSHGTLEIEVTEPYTATGNNVPQAPQAVSVADYNANHDAYESELIKITNVLVDATGTTFALNTNYTVTDANDNTQTVVLRTIFPDLAGQTIPTDPVNITCIGGEYNGTAQIYPRDINDFETIQAIAKNDIAGLKVYPNPVKNKQVFVASESAAPKQIIIYNVLGKAVINTNVNNQQPINIGQLKAGIYMMKIIENNHLAVEKLIVK